MNNYPRITRVPEAFQLMLLSLVLLSVSAMNLTPPAVARTFKPALPGYVYKFPRDHAAHEEFKTEWWYYTGHISTESGKKFGYELTFFRHGLEHESSQNKKLPKNVYLAHFALTDETTGRFRYFERMSRSGLPIASAASNVFSVQNQGWTTEQLGNNYVLKAESDGVAISLLLSEKKPPVVHGKDGVSQKASCKGCASHYYSMTRLDTKGLITIDGKTETVVAGLSWMDHEFGSNQLTEEQVGWDWYSIQLDNNTELMLYVMRRRDGTLDKNSSGTIIGTDGSTKHLSLSDFKIKPKSSWKSPNSHGVYPMGWSVQIPSLHINLTLDPVGLDQELLTKRSTGVTYWEGSANVVGDIAGQTVKGHSYVEMTGYAEAFRKDI